MPRSTFVWVFLFLMTGPAYSQSLERTTEVSLKQLLESFFLPKSDSGIAGPKYSEIENDLIELARAYPEKAQHFAYGTSVAGRNLNLIRISYGTPKEGAPAVLMTGAIHGNEYLGIEGLMPRYILETGLNSGGYKKFLEKGGVIYIVPIVNPDGYETSSRYNNNGVDLNRDFDHLPTGLKNFSQPETKELDKFLSNEVATYNLQLKLTMEYHCCAGAWLYPWSYTDSPIPEVDLRLHQDFTSSFLGIFGANYEAGTTGQVLGYNPMGTSKDFYYARYGAVAFTFEGQYHDEVNNFEFHVRMWDSILSQF